MLLFFWATSYTSGAAQSLQINRSHALQSLHQLSDHQPEVPDNITIVAVRVAFQADENRLTSGDGTFGENSLPYLANNEIAIDPLPHDRSYFEAHLEFAKNYFSRVSDNQLQVDYRLLPDIYQLDLPMEAYSPTGETFTNEKLAELARDVWQKVEENGGFDATGLDPERTAFVIFHAGVGRDIELTGTTLDITPQDIPSITLNRNALSRLLEEPDFTGFPVNNGTFRISNSLILPRTLSRRGEDFTGTEFVLQLSINGLICASIGSYLGLPDLFDTATGNSGIGRFGLMDGESFFSYRGIFPPEPSAWEKKWLGWQEPFIIDAQADDEVQLPAASFDNTTTIAQYKLSTEEYFLVENRHRDPENDGATLTIQRPDGSIIQQTFDNTNQVFVNQEAGFEELLEPGVLVDIDNFDWSLPGGLDPGPDANPGTDDDRFLNGGILIWHIDEGIIKDELSQQNVNANPDRRGVDLEEADGAQDIGRAANTTFSSQARGWAFDFWWSGNDARVVTLQNDTLSLYQNRFAYDTRPSNHSNTGAASYFEFYDFSENLPVASFRLRPATEGSLKPLLVAADPVPGADSYIGPDEAFRNHYPAGLSFYTATSDSFLIIPTQSSTYALHLNGDIGDGFYDFNQPQPQHPYIGNRLILATAPSESPDINLNAWSWDGTNWQNNWQASVPANLGFISSANGDTLEVDFTTYRLLAQDGSPVPALNTPQQRSAKLTGKTAVLEAGTIRVEGSNFSQTIITDRPRIHTGAVELQQNRDAFYLLSDRELQIINPSSPDAIQTVAESSFLNWPALVDFDGDQRTDILYVDGATGELIGKHSTGAVMSHFPIAPPDGARFIGTPLVADINGNGEQNVVITVQDSVSMTLYGYDRQGEILQGFPLLVGGVTTASDQPIHPIIVGNTLYALSHIGELKAWQIPDMQNVLWPSLYGKEPYNKVTGRLSGSEAPPMLSRLLVTEETYNWPNPANEMTHIRYQISEAATVEIKIITPGGRILYDRQVEASGGNPEEHTINTSGWSSGIYFAMVTAKADGREERKMIKIAIVH